MRPMRAALPVLWLAGCAVLPPAPGPYGPPDSSGLVGVRPWPGPGEVCQVIGENDLTRDFLDDTRLLIGCPRAERGTIAAHTAKGAQRVGAAGDWVLLSLPQ